MEQERLDYADPNLPGRTGRTFGQWIILLITWTVGLAVWAVYLVAIGFVALRFLVAAA